MIDPEWVLAAVAKVARARIVYDDARAEENTAARAYRAATDKRQAACNELNLADEYLANFIDEVAADKRASGWEA